MKYINVYVQTKMCFEIISRYNSLLWIRLDVIDRLDRSKFLRTVFINKSALLIFPFYN